MSKVNKFGAILVMAYPEYKGQKNKRCMCKCSLCGNTYETWTSHYYRGSNPCQCRYHKKNNPRLYRIWTNMKTRCYNESSPNYKLYGARGISICDDWKNDFKSFLEWSLQNGYSDSLSIDRIDVNGNYEPCNCKWSNNIEQANNKRNNIKIHGMSVRRFCIENGINYKSAHTYISRYGFEKWRKRIDD